MTQELEHTLRRGYGNMTKNDLINHCIDLQRKIEYLEFRIACHDASNVLHDVAKEIEAETAAMMEEWDDKRRDTESMYADW